MLVAAYFLTTTRKREPPSCSLPQSPFRAPTMIYLLGLGASAFSSPACSSRVALSRVAQPVSTARVPLPLIPGG